VLISTSRHVRQMAFDIKDLVLRWRPAMLRGFSRAVAGDPYQLRIYVPEGLAGSAWSCPKGSRKHERRMGIC